MFDWLRKKKNERYTKLLRNALYEYKFYARSYSKALHMKTFNGKPVSELKGYAKKHYHDFLWKTMADFETAKHKLKDTRVGCLTVVG